MKILHIISDIHGSKVYDHLIKNLDTKGIEQTVYCTLYKNKHEKDIPFDNKSSSVINAFILTTFNRFFIPLKIWKIYKDVIRTCNMENINIIHCHSFFTSSTVGYLLAKKFNKKLIVTFRNTDINLFIKKIKVLNFFIKPIINFSNHVVFINHSYRKYMMNMNYINDQTKVSVIPNGVDEYWLSNIQKKKSFFHNPFKILYVGKITQLKNFSNLYQAVEVLRDRGAELHLSVVGANNNELIEYPNVENLGYINDKNKLAKIYRENDMFAMPSLRETFGLVYIEAISQGLPIVYSQDQGIDGFFEDFKFGEAVNPRNICSITEAIDRIMSNYINYSLPTKDKILEFHWSNIITQFIHTYRKILNEQTK